MEIKVLQERIEKKQIQIGKIEKRVAKWSKGLTQEQIEMAKLTWRELSSKNLDYDTKYQVEELHRALSDLKDAKETLKKYEEALALEINRENEEKIEVLVKFLENWKAEANEFYHKEAIRFNEAYRVHEAKLETAEKIESYKERNDEWYKENRRWENEKKEFSMVTRSLVTYRAPFINEEELEKVLTKEVKNKYQDLVSRISKVVGELNDCSNLSIGNNGSINGIVKGSKANARVETILAGGYNIQCLHYRVLVNKI